MRVGTFTLPVVLANPRDSARHVTVDLLVDTGATWTLLPAEIVQQLALPTRSQRTVTLANGERVNYGAGQVMMALGDEELVTMFLAGPPGSLGLLGAVTLEEFGLAPDPVTKRLVSVGGLLAAAGQRQGVARRRRYEIPR